MDLMAKIDKKSGEADITVSIVILTRNNLPITIDCLMAVTETLPDGVEAEIIVVDNHSTDGTRMWLAWFGSMYANPETNPHPTKKIRLRQILLDRNYGFPAGCNRGFRKAKGDVVVFLNNDAVVTPGWFEELLTPLIYVPEASFTAPVSNFSGGNQQVKAPYTNQEQMLKFAEENLGKNHKKAVASWMVTGLCLMAQRDFLQELVGFHVPAGQLFDERFFPGMWEDNDLCLRARLKSRQSLVCQGAFVHHEGSKTISKLEITPRELFERNQRKFREKWQKEFPAEDKIVAMLRVKNGIRHIRRYFESLEWVDEIVVLDTGSTDGTIEVVEENLKRNGGKVAAFNRSRFRDKSLQEYKERQFLLEMAQKRNPTWIVRQDVDEAVELKIRDKLPLMLRPLDPQTLCWQLPMKTFWRGEKKYRIDGDWGKMCPMVLFRNMPGDKLFDNKHPQGFHTPTVPVFQSGNVGFVNVSILHYGYSSYREAQRKHTWYVKTDTEKRRGAIGGRGNYSHLVDESGLKLLDYHPDGGISLLMMARANELEGAAKVIEAVAPFVDEIILVYTDNQVEGVATDILEIAIKAALLEYTGFSKLPILRVYKYDWNDDFSAARNFGLAKCTRRWVMYLDPDEELSSQDLGKISAVTERDETIIHIFSVLNLFDDPGETLKPRANIQESIRLFRNMPGKIYFANLIHETLCDALEKIKGGPPPPGRPGVLVRHKGYLASQEDMNRKMYRYAQLSMKWAEQAPNDSRPLYNLGLHYLDLDDIDTALDYFERARKKDDGKLWQVNQALMGIYLRNGQVLAEETMRNMPEGHPRVEQLKKIVEILAENVGEVQHVIREVPDGDSNSKALRQTGAGATAEVGKAGGDKIDQAGKQAVHKKHQPDGSLAKGTGGHGASISPRGKPAA